MNIGIVCYPTFGGSGVVATELGKSLAQRGHIIHFITYDRPIRLGHFTQNITFHEVRLMDYPLFQYPPYESALASSMVDVARHNNLDLFHVHYAIPHAASAVMARQILKGLGKTVPVVTTLHGTDITLVGKNKSYEPVVTWSIDESNGVTAVSEFLKEATYQSFPVKKEIEVIPNFVDLERFFRQDKEHFKKMVAPNNEKIMIHTSNFRPVKRTEDVIKVFCKVRQKFPAKLLMVGDGPERAAIEEMSRKSGIGSDIIFLGTQNPVEEIYSIGDIFIMPSETESFGLAALEAMACGMPVIATNVGGLPEINKNGITGFGCEIGDVDGMAAKSIELLENKNQWNIFSNNALNQAREFSPEKIVPHYENFYTQILEKSKEAVI